MPFKSKQQMKWMFANKPKMAKEFSKDTKSSKSLPDKVTKLRSGKKVYKSQKRAPTKGK